VVMFRDGVDGREGLLNPVQHLVEQLEVDAPEDLLVTIRKNPSATITG
jgi:hypothetical protein